MTGLEVTAFIENAQRVSAEQKSIHRAMLLEQQAFDDAVSAAIEAIGMTQYSMVMGLFYQTIGEQRGA